MDQDRILMHSRFICTLRITCTFYASHGLLLLRNESIRESILP